jgi:hypothetical protein
MHGRALTNTTRVLSNLSRMFIKAPLFSSRGAIRLPFDLNFAGHAEAFSFHVARKLRNLRRRFVAHSASAIAERFSLILLINTYTYVFSFQSARSEGR